MKPVHGLAGTAYEGLLLRLRPRPSGNRQRAYLGIVNGGVLRDISPFRARPQSS